LIKKHLVEEAAQDMNQFIDQYADALWLEDREADVMAGAISKALGRE
jgi:hypothetical protein